MEKLIEKLENELEQQEEFCRTINFTSDYYNWEKGYCKSLEYCIRQIKLFYESRKNKE